jgi:hypothetical protein
VLNSLVFVFKGCLDLIPIIIADENFIPMHRTGSVLVVVRHDERHGVVNRCQFADQSVQRQHGDSLDLSGDCSGK